MSFQFVRHHFIVRSSMEIIFYMFVLKSKQEKPHKTFKQLLSLRQEIDCNDVFDTVQKLIKLNIPCTAHAQKA